MAKINKPTVRKVTTTKVDPETGNRQTIKSERYYVEIRIDGQNKRCPGYKEKRSTESLANRLYKYLCELAEGDDPNVLQEKTLSELKDQMDNPARGPSLVMLCEEFEKMLTNKEDDPEWVKTKCSRVRGVIAGCGWKWPCDMREADVVAFTARLRNEMDRSKRTTNHHIVAIKHFAAWLVRNKHADHNPLAYLEVSAVDDADLRHVRRVLTVEEFARLVQAARNSTQTVYRLTGPDRMMLYTLAAYTGFRAAELSSMTPASLALLDPTPTATVAAGYTKNGKKATNPLHADLVGLLLPWVAGKPQDCPLWPGRTWPEQGARMLRVDLDSAGIPYRDDKDEVFDFHALRCQFITNLALAGVHPAVAQMLARHSKPELTLNIYTKLNLKPQADAVNKLPALPAGFVA